MAAIRGPYCVGAFTPSGNAARVRLPQDRQRQAYAWCSVPSRGCGWGRSNTCRRTGSPWVSAADSGAAHSPQLGGRWVSMRCGLSVCRKVAPLCPGCPPGRLPERPRWLRVRFGAGGLAGPSLDGGLPLLPLFRPTRRSSSSRRCCNPAISACCRSTVARSCSFAPRSRAFSACASARRSAPPVCRSSDSNCPGILPPVPAHLEHFYLYMYWTVRVNCRLLSPVWQQSCASRDSLVVARQSPHRPSPPHRRNLTPTV